MRAVIYSSFGDPASVIELGERPTPEPGPGQVRVKMTRAAIHNHDLWTIRGSYGQRPALPAIGGSEGAGVVDALGEGVSHLKVGQRVAGFGAGTWSEHFVTLAAGAVPLPDAISDDAGCQLVAMPLSALVLLDTYAAEGDDFIVQNAANGAVGKTLARIAKVRGKNVLNLVRSEAGVRELEAQGIAGAIDTSKEDWRDQVKKAIGSAKIRCAIDSIGGQASGDLCSLLASGGKLVAFGSMSGEPMKLDPGPFIFKQVVLEGFWLSKQNQPAPERMGALVTELVKLVAGRQIELPVAGVFSLDRAREAVTASIGAARGGKIVLSP
ncbi:MAG: zinc-binding dehydrogenase [Deltaproteobacteria bacterium]|nr:zinc-binding dehydrogenase [Deltaproteobacteria bacterium]